MQIVCKDQGLIQSTLTLNKSSQLKLLLLFCSSFFIFEIIYYKYFAKHSFWQFVSILGITTANSTFAIGCVSYSADSFMFTESSVLRINICAKNPAHRKSANRVCLESISLNRN
jgi:hypothetical protein